MEDLLIRPAVEADLPALLALVQALTRHHADAPRVTLATLKRDVFGAAPWFQVLVAEAGAVAGAAAVAGAEAGAEAETGAARLVGYAALLPLARLGYGERGMDLHHLFVVEAAQRGGVGQALVRASEALARGLGCSYLIIGTHPGNRAAQEYYQRIGYDPIGTTSVRFTRRLGVVEG